MNMLLVVVSVVFVVLVLFVLAKLFGSRAGDALYVRRDPVFTPAERSFYGVLKQVCGDQAEVLGKVRVADVLKPKGGLGRSKWQTAFNRIAAKHFDYVLCDPGDLSVIAAIELNDASHKAQSRSQRDVFLASACEGAGLPLHFFNAKRGYSIDEVRGVLFPEPALEVDAEPQSLPSLAADSPAESGGERIEPVIAASPACPKCGSALVERIARKGKHAGQHFMACADYPACRFIRAVED